MHKNVIFCFSGTGNCLDLAKNVARGLGGADIVMLRKTPAVTDVREAERVGFVFPCYGGGAPEDVLKYARTIQVGKDAYTFAACLCSAYAGTGLYELNKIIPLKYWRVVTHQCSCIWLFPHRLMMPMLSPAMAQARSEKIAGEIAWDVLAMTVSKKSPPNNPVNRAENAAWPLIAKKKIAAFHVSDACISCGQCEKLCPRGNIRMENGRPVFDRDCAQCLGCLQFCPKEAISIGKITDKREHYHNPNVKAADLMQSVIRIE